MDKVKNAIDKSKQNWTTVMLPVQQASSALLCEWVKWSIPPDGILHGLKFLDALVTLRQLGRVDHRLLAYGQTHGTIGFNYRKKLIN